MSVLFKFLDNATKMPTLLQIRREIEGEIEDDSDSEGEEEDVDVERRVRHVSKTLFALLKEAGATTIGFKSDWSCFLAFLTEHISESCDLKKHGAARQPTSTTVGPDLVLASPAFEELEE